MYFLTSSDHHQVAVQISDVPISLLLCAALVSVGEGMQQS